MVYLVLGLRNIVSPFFNIDIGEKDTPSSSDQPCLSYFIQSISEADAWKRAITSANCVSRRDRESGKKTSGKSGCRLLVRLKIDVINSLKKKLFKALIHIPLDKCACSHSNKLSHTE